MKENMYDNQAFFSAYAKMNRSIEGLEAAGEWHDFQALLPELDGLNALDLGCGYGWHCRYLRQNGAKHVVGVDSSQKMLQKAQQMTSDTQITYLNQTNEDFKVNGETFDLIISSLAIHYIKDYRKLIKHIAVHLKDRGVLLFSVEHPIFTAKAEQDWYYVDGDIDHWPIDHYQDESQRLTSFLGHPTKKYHRTLATYINTLIENNLMIEAMSEPKPPQSMLDKNPSLSDELRRPMMLIIKARKI
ncbi:class I SAM-dependent methyltransferase [Fundicoccus culcitae]|uniref:Class I SAM-dependent methyltransferase n=1 Tax=Fundicoccus culcitae TaxID=2969821 RepID=A0ABY5P5Z8_9LACT|nr:class I SAM-dependent methyltransferase [Fundicoccus culcitae]UUX34030.1 class I SAM-dependent methyltransferase [Fundicoccus culcitae]